MRALLENSVDANKTTKYGKTYYDVAIQSDHWDIVRIFERWPLQRRQARQKRKESIKTAMLIKIELVLASIIL